MSFNLREFNSSKLVMHCKTAKEARDFCSLLHRAGREWSSGMSYDTNTKWDDYEHKTCYNFNEGTFSSVNYYKSEGFTILEWSDYMAKKELSVGDKVTVLHDLKEGNYGDNYATNDMEVYAGKKAVITEIVWGGNYKIDVDGGKWNWTPEMFENEVIRQPKPEPLKFTKDDFVAGMVIDTRDEGMYLYLNGMFMHEDGWESFAMHHLNDELRYDLDSDYDVMAVYKTNGTCIDDLFDECEMSLIWERNEHVEMTIGEVEAKLGIKGLKIVY